MAPQYKLTYFNSRGLAEMSRLIFAYAGVEYEDVRLERGPQWDEFKPKTPFGVMPILEFDGEVIGQSRAIARYLANKYGLAGKSPLESAKCDMLVDGLFDLYPPIGKWYMEKDPTKKEELWQEFINGPGTNYAKAIEKFLQPNGFLVGDGLTWADLAIAQYFSTILMVSSTALDNHPSLKSYMDKIFSIPKIKEWVDKRPVTAT